jgi:hypothetical protein
MTVNILTGFNAGLYAKPPITNSIAFNRKLITQQRFLEQIYDNALGTSEFNINYIEVLNFISCKFN